MLFFKIWGDNRFFRFSSFPQLFKQSSGFSAVIVFPVFLHFKNSFSVFHGSRVVFFGLPPNLFSSFSQIFFCFSSFLWLFRATPAFCHKYYRSTNTGYWKDFCIRRFFLSFGCEVFDMASDIVRVIPSLRVRDHMNRNNHR